MADQIMNWYAQNNAYGGISCVQALTAPDGHIQITDDQMVAIGSAPAGSTIDTNGNVVQPTTPVVPVSQHPASIHKRAVRGTILNGFQSSALGNAYTYPSGETDQRNLALVGLTAASHGTGLPMWCQDSSGNWVFSTHTAAQVLQVVADFNSFRVAQSSVLAT